MVCVCVSVCVFGVSERLTHSACPSRLVQVLPALLTEEEAKVDLKGLGVEDSGGSCAPVSMFLLGSLVLRMNTWRPSLSRLLLESCLNPWELIHCMGNMCVTDACVPGSTS